MEKLEIFLIIMKVLFTIAAIFCFYKFGYHRGHGKGFGKAISRMKNQMIVAEDISLRKDEKIKFLEHNLSECKKALKEFVKGI